MGSGNVTGSTTNEKGMLIGSAKGAVTLTNAYISGGTAVGKCTGTVPTALVETNQTTLKTSLNNAVGTNRTWTIIGGAAQPTLPYKVTYSMGSLPAGHTIELLIDTSFEGCNTIYPAFIKGKDVVVGETMYTFKDWYTASSGGSVVGSATAVTKNTTLYAQWNTAPHTMKPVPFD